jgi:hypothetical protein
MPIVLPCRVQMIVPQRIRMERPAGIQTRGREGSGGWIPMTAGSSRLKIQDHTHVCGLWTLGDKTFRS